MLCLLCELSLYSHLFLHLFFCIVFVAELYLTYSCGIVLCSRDSKFAVDCDTCRLSYCLVCLASGGKDPCIRCGHRPTKRMEQLVHLRLKSIYKAFKQSSGGSSEGMKSSNNTRERQNDDPDEVHLADDPEILLQAAAASASNLSAAAKSKLLSKKKAAAAASSSSHSDESSEEALKKQKEKADAAAAALLLELEEEEEAAKSKKNKKKRKKERQQAKKEEKKKEDPVKGEPSDDDSANEKAAKVSPEDMDTSTGRAGLEDTGGHATVSAAGRGGYVSDVDPLEEELSELVEDSDIEGIEKLLQSMKGVPGRAAIRKTAKKALKRLKSDLVESEEADTVPAEAVAISRPGAMTPVHQIDKNGRTTELLSLMSLTHNKTASAHGLGAPTKGRSNSGASKSECIFNMAPHIVGWVIGKGGQRIRDMMEESGARIWIDQDTMGPQDPRLCYISGQRKCVETAMHMLKELIEKAPGTTPKASTPGVESSALNPKIGKPPTMPDDAVQSDSAGDFVLEPRHTSPPEKKPFRGPPNTHGDVKQILTCDPRFVPLLIGRRGWTIKHIQDTSLAWVDIDQSVTPRRITISGKPEHVEVAVEMVNDVLSYPQSQLQGSAEVIDEDVLDVVEDAENPPEEKQQVPEKDSPIPASPEVDTKTRMHPSPPASLIMTTDAKSTVSASSSLSSTPEPSSASTKSPHIQMTAANMLPPMQGPYSANAGAEFRSASIDQRQGGIPVQPSALNNMSGKGDFLRAAQGAAAFNQATVVPSVPMGTGIQQHAAPVGSIQDLSQSIPLNKETSLYQPPLAQPPTQSIPLPAGLPKGPIGQPQQSRYLAPQQTLAAHVNGPVGQPALLSRAQSNDRMGAMAGPALWEKPIGQTGFSASTVPNAGPPGSEGFHFDAAMEFLKHSKETLPSPAPGPVASLLRTQSSPLKSVGHPVSSPGPSIRNHLSEPDANNPLSSLGRDDSNMIDSLFGPTKVPGNESSLLAGLQGLSLESDKGLWSAPRDQTASVLTETKPEPLFPDAQAHHTAPDQRPLHSRFAWGESNGL